MTLSPQSEAALEKLRDAFEVYKKTVDKPVSEWRTLHIDEVRMEVIVRTQAFILSLEKEQPVFLCNPETTQETLCKAELKQANEQITTLATALASLRSERRGLIDTAYGGAFLEAFEMEVFECFATGHPREAYGAYPEWFWVFFHREHPTITRPEMEALIAAGEKENVNAL